MDRDRGRGHGRGRGRGRGRGDSRGRGQNKPGRRQQPEGQHQQSQPPRNQQASNQTSSSISKQEQAGKADESLLPCFSSQEEKKKMCGTKGKPVFLFANHFPMSVKIPNNTIYHYDIEFNCEGRKVSKGMKKLLVQAVEEMKKKYQKEFNQTPPGIVFDGFKNLYSLENLSDFEGFVEVNDEYLNKLKIQFQVKLAGNGEPLHFNNEIKYYLEGRTRTTPTKHVQILNIILGMTPLGKARYQCFGRSFFDFNAENMEDLGEGKSLAIGTFQSVRLGWEPMLNVDVANRPSFVSQTLLKFVETFLKSPNDLGEELKKNGRKEELNEELEGLKITYRNPKGWERGYRINKLVGLPGETQIEEKQMSVRQYFEKELGYDIKDYSLPLIHVGPKDKKIYLPIELCRLKDQLASKRKNISDNQKRKMIEVTANPPSKRKEEIERKLKSINQGFKNDPYAINFGIRVSAEMMKVPGRVLKAPSIKYDGNNQSIKDGKWNMGNSNNPKYSKKWIQTTHLRNWTIINLAHRLNDQNIISFVENLYNEAIMRGYDIEYPTEYKKIPIGNSLEMEFKKYCQGKKFQLVMVIVDRKSDVYQRLKYVGDIEMEIPTQFIMMKGRYLPNNSQTLHNICLKMNAKTGGVNHGLPDFMNDAMFLGVDVTHSTDQKKPSIAAMVASTDRQVSKYFCEVRVQHCDEKNRFKVVEEITTAKDMVKNILKKFSDVNDNKNPKRIIYYRDGVSEGQFAKVLNRELQDIWAAWRELCGNQRPPPVTFIVAQKRHHTRLFVEKENDGVGKMKNVPPGTVVDTHITHPTEYDFFLASHEGIKGTTKPTHYHVLWDDSKFTLDELQSLTYNLCHLYSRCERSVSYPAPTYYAHLAAERARRHHDYLFNKYKGRIPQPALTKLENPKLKNYFL